MKATRSTAANSVLLLAALATFGTGARGQVRSEMPPPISGLGGVRAAFPTFTPIGPDNGATVPLPPAPVQHSFVRPPMGGSRGSGSGGFGHRSGGGFVSGSGFSANGAVSGDHFRLAVHVGSPLGGLHDHVWPGHDHFGHHHDHAFAYAPFFYNPWWYDYGYGYGNHYDNIYGFYGPADPSLSYASQPAPAPAPVTLTPEPSTPKELAATYLRAGDPKAAASALRTWMVDNPRDAEALRLLGLALIDAGSFADGSAAMSLAYHNEPLLGLRRLTPDVVGSVNDLREDVRRTSFYANRVRSSSAWLSLAVLMQAEGRDSTARNALQKARAAGLEPAVADRLEAALQ